MFGVPLEQLVGKTLEELPRRGFPEQIASLIAGVREAFEQGVANTRAAVWPTEGGDRLFEVRHVPEIDEHGKVVSVLGITRDITERKRAENIRDARLHLLQFAATHSLEELLQATLDELETLTESQIGFYHFLEADQQTLSLQTWSTRTLRDACTAEGGGRHYSVSEAGVWVDCIRERRPVVHNDYASLPHRKGMPPGHAPVIRELVVPVFRGDRIVAVLGVGNKPRDYVAGDVEIVSNLADLAWDIAERKRVETQAQERREELLHVSRLNTLGEMASGLAHELSQPLSAILNYAIAGARRAASGRSDANGIAQTLEKIADQAKRAGNILGRIRSLARRRPAQFASVTVNEIVEDVIDLISWETRHKEVAIRRELDPELPAVSVDRMQIVYSSPFSPRKPMGLVSACRSVVPSWRCTTEHSAQNGTSMVEVRLLWCSLSPNRSNHEMAWRPAMRTMGTPVFIVEDDDAAREGLQDLVESVGLKARAFPSAEEFLDSYDRHGAGVCCSTCACPE